MNRGKVSFAFVLALLAGISLALAKDDKHSTPQRLPQTFREVILSYESQEGATATQLPVTPTFDEILCDDSGSIYLRPMLSLEGGAFANSVVRIEKDGTTHTFDAAKAPGLREVYVFAYTVDRSGRVYEIARTVEDTTDEMYLVSFDRTGDVLSKSRFASKFRPYAFTALRTGDFLISGMQEDRAAKTSTSVVGIFGPDAVLKRSLKTAADDTFLPVSSKAASGASIGNPAIELGSAKVGDDDLLYVLKGSKPARLEVFDLSGRRIRTLTLAPPFPDSQGHEFFVTANRIIVMYQQPRRSEGLNEPVVFAAYNLQDGEPLLKYLPRGKGLVACFDSSEAKVLTGGRDGRFAILRVRLEH